MTTPEPAPWHVPDDELVRYAALTLGPPLLWSTEAHLTACSACRNRLTVLSDPALVEGTWARIDATMDAPVPGVVERILLAVGVSDHTARLLVATPALRLSWLGAVALTAALAAVLAHVAVPIVFLAVAPLLPLVGVAASYGRGIDPTYEITLVAPMHSFRLLLLRCVAVLSLNTVLCAVASLTLPGFGPQALSWFLPSLALTVLALVLTPRLGPITGAAIVGVAWAVLVVGTGAGTGRSVVFGAIGQLAVLATAVLATAVLAGQASTFDRLRFGGPTRAWRRW